MKKLALSLILIGFGPFFAAATPETAMFGVEPGSLEWKRAELEEWLVNRTTKDITPFLRPELFRVQAKVTFKGQVRAPKRTVTNVNIPLLGTVATLVQGGEVEAGNPAHGIFNRVDRIDLTLIVADQVEQATVDQMVTIMKKQVPIIKPDNVGVEVVKFQNPAKTWGEWASDNRMSITLVLMMAVFMIGLYVTLPRVKLQTYVRMGPAIAEVAKQDKPKLVPVAMSEAEPKVATDATTVSATTPGADLLNNAIGGSELKRLRGIAMTLSIADCIELVKSNSKIGSILVSILSPEKSMRVVAQLPDHVRKDLTMQTLEWTPESLAKNAESLLTMMQAFRGVSHASGAQVHRLAAFVEQVGPENEEAVFAELARHKKFQELKTAAFQAPPASLIPRFPRDLLLAAFERLSFADRASLLAVSARELAEVLCPPKSLDQVIVSLRKEAQQIKKDPMALAEANAVWPRYVTLTREALHKNTQFQSAVAPLIDEWLHHKSNGAIGVAGGKAKKGHDAA